MLNFVEILVKNSLNFDQNDWKHASESPGRVYFDSFQQYLNISMLFQCYFNVFNYFQLILLYFNYFDPMDQLQQVLHLFQVPHLHPSVMHKSTKKNYISTYFNMLSLYFNNFQLFLKKSIVVEHYQIFSNQLLIFQPISGLK